MMVLIDASLFELDIGPYWLQIEQTFSKPCRDNWWATLFYIQNYYAPTEDVSMEVYKNKSTK